MSISRSLFDEVMRLDNFTCVYCGVRADNLTVDHLVPRSLGGADLIPNLAACCLSCNSRKGAKPLYEAQMFPHYGRYAYVALVVAEVMAQQSPLIEIAPEVPALPRPTIYTLRPLTERDRQVLRLLQAEVPGGKIIRQVWEVPGYGNAFRQAGRELAEVTQQLLLHAEARQAQEAGTGAIPPHVMTDPVLQAAQAAGATLVGMIETLGGYIVRVDTPGRLPQLYQMARPSA